MENVAFYYESTTILWSSLLIGLAVLLALALGAALYATKRRNLLPYVIGSGLVYFFGVFLSRYVYYACNVELFDSWLDGIRSGVPGGYCIWGMLFSLMLLPWLCKCLKLIPNANELRDALSPGMAFVLAMSRFTCSFTGKCTSKVNDLPIGIYHFAWLAVIAFVLVILWYKEKMAARRPGWGFTILLVNFSLSEIIVDSARKDSLYFTFYAPQLADLNKVTCFMGFSQFIAVVVLLVLWFKGKKHWTNGLLFLLGLLVAGASEYLLQRYSGKILLFTGVELLGAAMMAASIFWAYFGTAGKPKKKESVSQ